MKTVMRKDCASLRPNAKNFLPFQDTFSAYFGPKACIKLGPRLLNFGWKAHKQLTKKYPTSAANSERCTLYLLISLVVSALGAKVLITSRFNDKFFNDHFLVPVEHKASYSHNLHEPKSYHPKFYHWTYWWYVLLLHLEINYDSFYPLKNRQL